MKNMISTCNKNGLRDENKKKRLDYIILDGFPPTQTQVVSVYICDTFPVSLPIQLSTPEAEAGSSKERVTTRILSANEMQ